MKNEALIRTYTRPLFDLAIESKNLESIAAELQALADLFRQVPTLSEYLASPNISRSAKHDLIEKALDRPCTKYFSNFLGLVLRKRRQEILPEAAQAYRHMWDDYRRHLEVTVTSAVELTPGQKSALESRLARKTGETITVKTKLDPAVLGGIRVQIGHQLVDGTVTNMLALLREKLLKS